MLEVLVVRILAGAGLAASLIAFAVGARRRRRTGETIRVVATRTPARWTVAVWIGGTFALLLWPIGILAAPTYAIGWPSVPSFPFSDGLQILGFLLWIAGGVLFFTAMRALGHHMTPAIQAQEGHQLVQNGPYRYVRHPVYTANMMIGAGLSLLALSPPLAFLTLLLIGIANYRARLEENLLRSPEVFGTAYDSYMGRTGRFLPRTTVARP